MRNSLLRMFLIVILAATLTTGGLSYVISQRSYETRLDNSMTEYIDLFTVATNSVGLDRAMQDFKTTMDGLRITIIHINGEVVSDTDASIDSLVNHSNRPEIKEAMGGGIGISQRYSKTTLIEYRYVAQKVMLNGQEMIVRMSLPMDYLNKLDRNVFLLVFLGITIGALVALLFAYRYAVRVTKPIEALSHTARAIAEGSYLQSLDNLNVKYELADLCDEISNMGKMLDKNINTLNNKNYQLKTIIDSMDSGLIALDEEYKIILINEKAVKMLGLPNKDPKGLDLFSVFRNRNFTDFIINSENDAFHFPYLDKHFNVKKSNIGYGQGIIVMIHDVTHVTKLEHIRTEFVANVTHELKTPLTSIKGFTDTLKNGAIDNKETAIRFLDIIEIESDRLIRLINDILELSDIEHMVVEKDVEPVPLDEVVQEVFSLEKEEAQKANIRLLYENNSGLSHYISNKDRLKQLIINLVSNGIRYNKDNGEVSVLIEKIHDKLLIRVKDTGIGIENENISRLFERFYRVDRGRSRSSGGTGLGLSIVKHIVNIYDGEIYVESQPGKGSEFSIYLPMEGRK